MKKKRKRIVREDEKKINPLKRTYPSIGNEVKSKFMDVEPSNKPTLTQTIKAKTKTWVEQKPEIQPVKPPERCDTCKYYLSQKPVTGRQANLNGTCRRSHVSQRKNGNEWCGQYDK